MLVRVAALQAFVLSFALGVAPRVMIAEDLAPDLAAYMKACVSADDFQGSVLVAKNDKILFSGGYGLANVEHRVPNTTKTKFRIGSISKQFTSMAVLILQERGKLKIDDKISQHLDDAPETWKEITIHHLLTHTSGIPSFTGMSSYRRDMMLRQSTKQMVARFRDRPLEFAPGAEFRYNNSGYYLLGVIIERASGQTYAEFLRQEIFDPLGMKNSGYDRYEIVLKNRADGYDRLGLALGNATYLDMSQPFAAGSLYSTVEDLECWDRALRAGKLISAESYKAMYTVEKQGYAYGWAVSKMADRKLISHGGGINGFSTYILRIPDEKLCVIALTNVQPANASRVARDLAAVVLGESYDTPQLREPAEIEEGVLKAYEGKYSLRPGLVVALAAEGDKLVARAEGQPAIDIFPQSKTLFFTRGRGSKISFVKDEEGEVTGAVINQRGQLSVAKRIAGSGK